MNWKLMKITNSDHKKIELLNKKFIKEKLMKKICNYMIRFWKQQKKNMNQISNFKKLKCEKILSMNK